MLTVGGIIGGDEEAGQLGEIGGRASKFLRTKLYDEPFYIKIPVLTNKEKSVLDVNMPCDDGWEPEDFKIPSQYILDYRDIYRYLPSYGELLI